MKTPKQNISRRLLAGNILGLLITAVLLYVSHYSMRSKIVGLAIALLGSILISVIVPRFFLRSAEEGMIEKTEANDSPDLESKNEPRPNIRILMFLVAFCSSLSIGINYYTTGLRSPVLWFSTITLVISALQLISKSRWTMTKR